MSKTTCKMLFYSKLEVKMHNQLGLACKCAYLVANAHNTLRFAIWYLYLPIYQAIWLVLCLQQAFLLLCEALLLLQRAFTLRGFTFSRFTFIKIINLVMPAAGFYLLDVTISYIRLTHNYQLSNNSLQQLSTKLTNWLAQVIIGSG